MFLGRTFLTVVAAPTPAHSNGGPSECRQKADPAGTGESGSVGMSLERAVGLDEDDDTDYEGETNPRDH
jgi:hypothetical protein